MNILHEKYIANIMEIQRLSKPRYPKDMNHNELISSIREFSQKQRRLHRENDELLENPAFYYVLDIHELNYEQWQELQSFACALSIHSTQIDNALAYRIHAKLLDWALLHNDEEKIIIENYYCGLSAYYLSHSLRKFQLPGFSKEVEHYFKEGSIPYMDRLQELPIKSKEYVLRCNGNIRLAYDIENMDNPIKKRLYPEFRNTEQNYLDEVLRLRNFYVDDAPQYLKEGVPWDKLVYSFNMGCLTLLSILRTRGHNPQIENIVYESAKYVYKFNNIGQKNSEQPLQKRVYYSMVAAEFHKGMIDIDTLLERMIGYFNQFKDFSDLSVNGFYNNIKVPAYIREYWEDYSKDTKWSSEMETLLNHSRKYMHHLPPQEYFSVAVDYMTDHLLQDGEFGYFSSESFLDYLLSFHQPTYVHSLMVSGIAELLARILLETNPDYFKSVRHIYPNDDDIISFVKECGLIHDLGKLAILKNISFYGRSLFDNEFEIIKAHPYIGYYMIRSYPEKEGVAQVCLGHHKWYDNTKGYPERFTAEGNIYAPVIHLIQIADSLDAGTDNVGRSYAHAKTIEQLIDELKEGSGTRYDPQVVECFDKKPLSYWQDIISEMRENTYQKVFQIIHE